MLKPHLTWLISLPHALAIIKKLHLKKHRTAGYSFDLSEVDDQNLVWNNPSHCFYSTYTLKTVIFKLDIFYEKPEK